MSNGKMPDNKKTDTRVQFTKSRFQQALLDLMHEKHVAGITVRELCDRAGLNRGTFYLHYGCPQDVLNEVESNFLTESLPLLETFLTEDGAKGTFYALLKSLQDHRELMLLILGPNGDVHFQQKYADLARETTLRHWNISRESAGAKRLEFLFDYSFLGSLSVILNWLDGKYDLTVDEMTDRMTRLGEAVYAAIQK